MIFNGLMGYYPQKTVLILARVLQKLWFDYSARWYIWCAPLNCSSFADMITRLTFQTHQSYVTRALSDRIVSSLTCRSKFSPGYQKYKTKNFALLIFIFLAQRANNAKSVFVSLSHHTRSQCYEILGCLIFKSFLLISRDDMRGYPLGNSSKDR